MRKFLYISEVKIDDGKYQEVLGWGINPADFISSIISDHARDRGLMLETSTFETPESIYMYLVKEAELAIENVLMDDLQMEILNNRMCLGGNCEI
jgi:hypothetical protein